MKTSLMMLPFCLALGLPAMAQDNDKPKSKMAAAERPKDDATTAKDKAVIAIDKFIKGKGKPSKDADWKQHLHKPPVLEFDENSEYIWHIKTNKGDIAIRLMPDVAPMHVSSTMYLARLGFYDGIVFHRVIQGFMAQGGCPLGIGRGGPGYTYDGEFDPAVKHDRPGMLSMANTGRPMTDGSQFFLTFVPTPHLDGKHTIFGEVIGDGMTTVRALEKAGSRGGQTTEPLTMERTWITVRPKAASEKDAAKKDAANKAHDKDKKEGKSDKE